MLSADVEMYRYKRSGEREESNSGQGSRVRGLRGTDPHQSVRATTERSGRKICQVGDSFCLLIPSFPSWLVLAWIRLVFLLSSSAESKEDRQDPLQLIPFWSSGRRIPPPRPVPSFRRLLFFSSPALAPAARGPIPNLDLRLLAWIWSRRFNLSSGKAWPASPLSVVHVWFFCRVHTHPLSLVVVAHLESSLRLVIVTTASRIVLCTRYSARTRGHISGKTHWPIYIGRRRPMLGGSRYSSLGDCRSGSSPNTTGIRQSSKNCSHAEGQVATECGNQPRVGGLFGGRLCHGALRGTTPMGKWGRRRSVKTGTLLQPNV